MKLISKNIKEAKKNLEILEDKKFVKKIEKFAYKCVTALKNKKKIIFCGNGGSASDSNHLSAELVGRFMKNRVPINSLSLATNISSITAIANDFNFDKIFSRQLEAYGNKGDILFCITTSGKSKNIIKAMNTANKKGIEILLLSSLKATSLKFNTKFKILVPSKRTDRIQEMHILVGHIICEIIENEF